MAISFQGGTLYKKTSGGKIQYWKIISAGNMITTRYGQVDGKEQETTDVIKEGKNAGRSNATTPEVQAYREAEARWTKQLKKGYVKSIEEAQADKVDEVIQGGVAPMLAHRFDEHAHKIVYPAFAQPKFDGHRCVAVVKDGKASLWTRTRKPITGVPHIVADIEALAKQAGIEEELVLDGELYNHNYRDNFEELTSFLRQVEPKPGHEVVEYHLYDIADPLLTQDIRLDELARLFRGGQKFGALRRVETIKVADEDELMLAFDLFLADGYEGLMVRNATGMYANKRSYDLQKVKEFADAEFEIVGVEPGRGKMANKAIFVCKTTKGAEFRVKMKGSLAELEKYIRDPSLAIKKKLRTQFQGTTNTAEVPRFPVGLRIEEEM